MTILIVDDHEPNLYQLEVLLGGHGYRVVTAGQGAVALAKAREHRPDLIISDILMPVMDGFSLCRECKQDEHLRGIPFIFYTATYTDERDREFALSLGAEEFLVKPEEPEVFLRIVREVLGREVGDTPLPAPEAPVRLPIGAPEEEKTDYLQQYNEALIRKLEAKMQQLEREVAERRRSEQELRLRSAALEAAANAIIITGRDGVIHWVNLAFTHLTGYSAAETVGQNPRLLKSGKHDQDFYRNLWATVLAGNSWHGELWNRRKNGSLYQEEMTVAPVKDTQGRVTHFVAIKQDITERVALEKRMLRTQRMESIGTLASGIAHDLNNLLASILMSIELLRARWTDPESLKILETVGSSAHLGGDIVQQILTFARGVDGERIALQPRHLCNEILKFARDTFPKNIRVDYFLPKGLRLVNGDATQIQQVLMNLCINARDAMPAGGVLCLTAENQTVDESFASLFQDARPGNYVCVSVSDTGLGMPPEVLDRIFEPFYTTKEPGKGTGLGLATSLGILRSHGGFVQVASTLGQGSEFKVFLPAISDLKANGDRT